jgi:hypothetical protein
MRALSGYSAIYLMIITAGTRAAKKQRKRIEFTAEMAVLAVKVQL